MAWYLVVLITLVVFWTISIVLAQINEDYVLFWATGLLYPILYALTYPIRAMKRYEFSRSFYEKRGISKVQYVFGKRPKEK